MTDIQFIRYKYIWQYAFKHLNTFRKLFSASNFSQKELFIQITQEAKFKNDKWN